MYMYIAPKLEIATNKAAKIESDWHSRGRQANPGAKYCP